MNPRLAEITSFWHCTTAFIFRFCPMSLDEAYLDITNYVRKRATSDHPTHYYWKEQRVCQCEKAEKKQHLPSKTNQSSRGESHEKESHNVLVSEGNVSQNTHSAEESVEEETQAVCEDCSFVMAAAGAEIETFGCSDEEVVREMRHRIHMRTQLTASAGECGGGGG